MKNNKYRTVLRCSKCNMHMSIEVNEQHYRVEDTKKCPQCNNLLYVDTKRMKELEDEYKKEQNDNTIDITTSSFSSQFKNIVNRNKCNNDTELLSLINDSIKSHKENTISSRDLMQLIKIALKHPFDKEQLLQIVHFLYRDVFNT